VPRARRRPPNRRVRGLLSVATPLARGRSGPRGTAADRRSDEIAVCGLSRRSQAGERHIHVRFASEADRRIGRRLDRNFSSSTASIPSVLLPSRRSRPSSAYRAQRCVGAYAHCDCLCSTLAIQRGSRALQAARAGDLRHRGPPSRPRAQGTRRGRRGSGNRLVVRPGGGLHRARRSTRHTAIRRRTARGTSPGRSEAGDAQDRSSRAAPQFDRLRCTARSARPRVERRTPRPRGPEAARGATPGAHRGRV
jgi:hypothetical protein